MTTSMKGMMALLVSVAMAAGPIGMAQADAPPTISGPALQADDGRYSLQLGTLVQLDGYLDRNDDGGIGSGAPGEDPNSTVRFRRAWITLAGNVHSFDYHIDYDFVTGSLNRAWVSHGLLRHGTLYIGQDKPWASLDELARNYDTPFLERNIVSASGVNAAATYTDGLYYEWHDHAVTDTDNLWWGLSASSLHKQGEGTDTGTQGTAFNARVAYAPLVAAHRWLHVGASFINANASAGTNVEGTDELLASYVYGDHFDSNEKLTLASYSYSAARGDAHSNTLAGELAGAYGPAYLQAEYARAAFHQGGEPDNTVTAYSVTAAYAITGETRPYKVGAASYGGIVPAHDHGAFELAVRYDHARNDGGGPFHGLKLTDANPALATLDEVSLLTVGLNYYADANVRFTVDFEHGRADLGRAGSDSPNTVGVRAQIGF